MPATAFVEPSATREDRGRPTHRAERGFRVMGTDAHVLVWAEPTPLLDVAALLDGAEARLRALEARWSRFLEHSDISAINRAHGTRVPVHPETIDLLELAERARETSGGCFDICILRRLEAAGYDRTFDELVHAAPVREAPDGRPRDDEVTRPVPARHAGTAVTIDRTLGRAGVTSGSAIDVGGIGKGRAADLAASWLVQEGARGACVNLGGDLRVIGGNDDADGFFVGVEDPWAPGEVIAVLEVHDGGIATSSRLRRTWQVRGEARHHLIDRSTGHPSTSGLASVTVVAPTATWADMAAKTAFLLGPADGAAFIEANALAALLTHDDGTVARVGDLERFER